MTGTVAYCMHLRVRCVEPSLRRAGHKSEQHLCQRGRVGGGVLADGVHVGHCVSSLCFERGNFVCTAKAHQNGDVVLARSVRRLCPKE